MKEAQIFESWINNLVEGTWAIPETPEQKQTLVDLMSKELPVGPDATNATEQLYNVFGDDVLFDQLQELADANANADARSVILTRMEELANESPDVEAVLGQLQTTNPGSPELETQPDAEELGQEVDGDETLPQDIEEAATCNETHAGEYCPEHGLEECGMVAGNVAPLEEYTGNWTNFGLEESDAVSQLKKLAHGK